MTTFTLLNPMALLTLPAVAGLVVLMRRNYRVRAALREQMADSEAAPERDARRWWRPRVMTLLAACLAIVALARPAHSPRAHAIQEGGRDIVFALDVSRSMLAADAKPSRLEKAKADIRNCVARHPGSRVGLVAFAGSASVKVPLTLDHDFVMLALDKLGPDGVAHGSTFMGAVFEKIADRLLVEERNGYQDLVLMTDGEDQGSPFEEALAALANTGVRLLVVGYGDPAIGARIEVPFEDGVVGFISHEGYDVWTRLQEERLQNMARAFYDGTYLNGTRGDFLMASVYRDWAAAAPRQPVTVEGDLVYQELYPVLMLLASLLLIPFPVRPSTALACTVLTLGGPVHVSAGLDAAVPDWQARFDLAVEHLEQDACAEARVMFETLSSECSDKGGLLDCLFNSALCCAHLSGAAESAQESLDWAERGMDTAGRFLLLLPRNAETQRLLEGLASRRRTAQQQVTEEQKGDAQEAAADDAQDGDPGETDFDEGEWEQDDGESGVPRSRSLQDGNPRTDFINKQLPLPDYSVEELLSEELENSLQRARRRASQGGEVKKDW